MSIVRIVTVVTMLLACASVIRANIVMETVHIGNAGNPADTRYTTRGFGAVDYNYNIGTYEVTAGQYTEFLNAVAATDPYGLYNTDMWSCTYRQSCGIERNGSPGNYSYRVESDWANRPVINVSWGDSARFSNWMHNGQGSGDTESGSYNLNGAMTDAELMAVTREPDATWVVPSEDEWYKAAYHKNNGATNDCFDYPTSSDTINTSMANYYLSGGGITEVGTYPFPSPYGTFDQGGNVWEWNEAVVDGFDRGFRGEGFLFTDCLHAADRGSSAPTIEYGNVGFRVARIPEPVTLALFAFSVLVVLRRR